MAVPLTSIIDIGANLSASVFRKDLAAVIERALKATPRTVKPIILTGSCLRSIKDSIRLCSKYNELYNEKILFTTAGIHPHHAKEYKGDVTYQQLRDFANRPSVMAIGETGLDYFRNLSPAPAQKESFRKHLDLAKELKMPLFLHVRDASKDFLDIMKDYPVGATKDCPAVVHCFTGTEEELCQYVKLDYHIGITGYICKKERGKSLREMLTKKIVPLNRLMIETDCPYMSPPRCGRRNEPQHLNHVLKTVAECYGVDEEVIAKCTSENARSFFRLDA